MSKETQIQEPITFRITMNHDFQTCPMKLINKITQYILKYTDNKLIYLHYTKKYLY